MAEDVPTPDAVQILAVRLFEALHHGALQTFHALTSGFAWLTRWTSVLTIGIVLGLGMYLLLLVGVSFGVPYALTKV